MRAFKGFNKDLTCRGYQYEEGKEFHTERAECCDTGFHACEYPLDCFGYYDPAHSVYHEVELSGEMDKSGDNTKVCATDIKIGARLSIAGLVKIKEYGFTNPIIVDADMVIIAGHTRREASILAGLDRVPYIVRDDLTPEQVKAYRIADNKLAELSNWDDELLKKELFELQAVDYSLEVMGFTEIDLKEIFTEKEVPKEKKKKEEKTTLPMLRFGSNSVRITEDELVMLSNRYNEYVESTPDEGFITWLLKRGL